MTIGAAIGATLLNAFLFVETGLTQLGPGAFQDAIASTVNAFLPGAGLHPAAQGPNPAPGATPVAVSGGS
jgi:hypothetical protein